LLKALEHSPEFPSEMTRSISEALVQLATSLEQNVEDSVTARANVSSTLKTLERRLSADQFAQFKRFAIRWHVQRMMPQGSVP
jgi:hypothetical protein